MGATFCLPASRWNAHRDKLKLQRKVHQQHLLIMVAASLSALCERCEHSSSSILVLLLIGPIGVLCEERTPKDALHGDQGVRVLCGGVSTTYRSNRSPEHRCKRRYLQWFYHTRHERVYRADNQSTIPTHPVFQHPLDNSLSLSLSFAARFRFHISGDIIFLFYFFPFYYNDSNSVCLTLLS